MHPSHPTPSPSMVPVTSRSSPNSSLESLTNLDLILLLHYENSRNHTRLSKDSSELEPTQKLKMTTTSPTWLRTLILRNSRKHLRNLTKRMLMRIKGIEAEIWGVGWELEGEKMRGGKGFILLLYDL